MEIGDSEVSRINKVDSFYQDYCRSSPTPEDFRRDGLNYIGTKVVENTSRFQALQNIIEDQLESCDITDKDTLRRRLLDLIVFNCHGRIFSIPNSCSDFIPVVDTDKHPELKDALVMILHQDPDGQYSLAFPGGYNDFGESIATTTVRELEEELGTSEPKNLVFCGEASSVERGGLAVSSLTSGLVDPDKLEAGDDAEGFVLVNVLDDKGNLNSRFNNGGTFKDARGEEFTIRGFRDDHWFLLIKFHEFWSAYGRNQGLSFQETLKRMSTLTPQEWFAPENAPALLPHEEILEDRGLKLTPNIGFALENVQKILQEAGVDNPENRAHDLIKKTVEAGVVPEYPQAPVTVDCLIIEDDNLVVLEDQNGRLRLPGTFFAPEENEFGENLTNNTQRVVADKTGIHYRPAYYLGCVGGKDVLGRYADTRGPRLTHVFVGQSSKNRLAENARQSQLPEGTKVIRIPIFSDSSRTQLSDRILSGDWTFSHNQEILKPLLPKFIGAFDPDNSSTHCEDLLTPLRLSY